MPFFSALLKHSFRIDLERLISKLILEEYLHQDISINDTYGTANAYLRLGKNNTFSSPITLSVCAKKENPNISSTVATNSTRNRLVDSCLVKLKDELKQISAEYNIKYSTILSEKALKQMASNMPRTKEEMLRKTVEMTTIKYDLYKFDRLLAITCLFGSKLDEENGDDSMNTSLKRKREAMTPTTSGYFQDKTNSNWKKKK
jgi:superfamily II DNA helicase RecQ